MAAEGAGGAAGGVGGVAAKVEVSRSAEEVAVGPASTGKDQGGETAGVAYLEEGQEEGEEEKRRPRGSTR